MSTVMLVLDEDASIEVMAVYDDIRQTRGTDFINNFWRALAVNPALLKSTWFHLKSIMTVEGEIDAKTREMIYIAVSTANACSYCVHSHTAAAKAKGMGDAEHAELMTIISLAASTNHLANGFQIPIDPEFLVE